MLQSRGQKTPNKKLINKNVKGLQEEKKKDLRGKTILKKSKEKRNPKSARKQKMRGKPKRIKKYSKR